MENDAQVQAIVERYIDGVPRRVIADEMDLTMGEVYTALDRFRMLCKAGEWEDIKRKQRRLTVARVVALRDAVMEKLYAKP